MRTKIIKKIFNTTITMFIILTIFTLKTTSNSNVLRPNIEIDDITNLTTNNIYLLNCLILLRNSYLPPFYIIKYNMQKK